MSRPHTPAYTVRRPPINQPTGAGIARVTTPTRPVITLDEWENKTTLNDSQLQSVTFVKEKLGERPFPEKVRIMTTEADFSLPTPRLLPKALLDHPRLIPPVPLESPTCSTRLEALHEADHRPLLVRRSWADRLYIRRQLSRLNNSTSTLLP